MDSNPTPDASAPSGAVATTGVAAGPSAEDTQTRTANDQRRLLKWGSVGVPLAALAEIVGNLEKVQHFVVELLGLRWSKHLHAVMSVVLIFGLVIGCLAISRWLYHRVAPRTRHTRIVFGSAVVVIVLAASMLAFAFAPRSPSSTSYITEESAEWAKRLSALQRKNGGIAVSFLDPNADTQVWATAQVSKALLSTTPSVGTADAARIASILWGAFEYIDHAAIRGADGRLLGWGYFEDWPTGVTEIAGWVGVAQASALASPWNNMWTSEQRPILIEKATATVQFLLDSQQKDGGWGPTADLGTDSYSRTYSTVMALWCLAEAERVPELQAVIGPRQRALDNAAVWLLTNRDASLGWVPNPFRRGQNDTFPGLTAQAMYVLLRLQALPEFGNVRTLPGYEESASAFLSSGELETRSLSANMRMHDSDRYIRRNRPATSGGDPGCYCPFTIEGSTFLWYPWTLATATALSRDAETSAEQRSEAEAVVATLAARLPEGRPLVNEGFSYVSAEFLIGVRAH